MLGKVRKQGRRADRERSNMGPSRAPTSPEVKRTFNTETLSTPADLELAEQTISKGLESTPKRLRSPQPTDTRDETGDRKPESKRKKR